VSLNERKQALVRDTIWEAAIDLFAEKGFNETTIDDIAASAGTSRRSVFRYFESKSDFMAQPIVSFGNSLIDLIRNCPASYSPAEILRRTLLTVAKNAASTPRTKKVMAIAAKYPEARQAQISRIAEIQELVTDALAERFRRTSRDCTVSRLLAALIPALLGVVMRNWFESDQCDISKIVENVLEGLRQVSDVRKAPK